MPIQIPQRRVSTLEKIAQAVGIAKDILSTGASVYGAVQEGKQTDIKRQEAQDAGKLAAKKYESDLAKQQAELEQSQNKMLVISPDDLAKYETSDVPKPGFS